MTLQQQQLDELADWLTNMEAKIATQGMMGSELAAIRQQVEDHKDLQAELDKQQRKVDSLQNMVVVVDDNNTESGTDTNLPSQHSFNALSARQRNAIQCHSMAFRCLADSGLLYMLTELKSIGRKRK